MCMWNVCSSIIHINMTIRGSKVDIVDMLNYFLIVSRSAQTGFFHFWKNTKNKNKEFNAYLFIARVL